NMNLVVRGEEESSRGKLHGTQSLQAGAVNLDPLALQSCEGTRPGFHGSDMVMHSIGTSVPIDVAVFFFEQRSQGSKLLVLHTTCKLAAKVFWQRLSQERATHVRKTLRELSCGLLPTNARPNRR